MLVTTAAPPTASFAFDTPSTAAGHGAPQQFAFQKAFTSGRHAARGPAPGRPMLTHRAVPSHGRLPRFPQHSTLPSQPFRRFCTGGALLPPRAPLADPFQECALLLRHPLFEKPPGPTAPFPRTAVSLPPVNLRTAQGAFASVRGSTFQPSLLRRLTRACSGLASLAADAGG